MALDVPTPHLIGCGSNEFGFDPGGVGGLRSPFTGLPGHAQDAVHGGL
jgi:hypothetical protein